MIKNKEQEIVKWTYTYKIILKSANIRFEILSRNISIPDANDAIDEK